MAIIIIMMPFNVHHRLLRVGMLVVDFGIKTCGHKWTFHYLKASETGSEKPVSIEDVHLCHSFNLNVTSGCRLMMK